MFKCELFSIQKNKADAQAYRDSAAEITAALEADGATVAVDRPSSTLERFFLDILRRTEEEGE